MHAPRPLKPSIFNLWILYTISYSSLKGIPYRSLTGTLNPRIFPHKSAVYGIHGGKLWLRLADFAEGPRRLVFMGLFRRVGFRDLWFRV